MQGESSTSLSVYSFWKWLSSKRNAHLANRKERNCPNGHLVKSISFPIPIRLNPILLSISLPFDTRSLQAVHKHVQPCQHAASLLMSLYLPLHGNIVTFDDAGIHPTFFCYAAHISRKTKMPKGGMCYLQKGQRKSLAHYAVPKVSRQSEVRSAPSDPVTGIPNSRVLPHIVV